MTEKPDDEGKKANAEGGTQREGGPKMTEVIFRYIGHKLPATQTYLQGTSNLLDRSFTKATTAFAGRIVVPPRVVTTIKGASMRLGVFTAGFLCGHGMNIFLDLHKKKKEKELREKQRAEDEMKKAVRRAEKDKTMSALVNDVTLLQREVKELNEWKVGVARAFSSSHRSLINRNTLTAGQIANEEITFAQRRF